MCWVCILMSRQKNSYILLGGNFALVGRPSVGASGAIVGTLAVLWVDLMAHWKLEHKPWIKLIGHIINLVLVVGLGEWILMDPTVLC